MALFTFITEKAGSTIIEQMEADDVAGAVVRWYSGSETAPGPPDPEAGDLEAVPITGVRNVWGFNSFDPKDVWFLVHVVATTGGDG